jgi:hypothetical protein
VQGHPVRPKDRDRHGEEGGVILELLFLVIILGILLGTVGLGIVIGFEVVRTVVSSTVEASGSQTLAARLQSDVSSATLVTTSSSQQQCGTGTQVLGLSWGQNVVSYSTTQTFTGSITLTRNYCASGFSAIPTTSEIIVSYEGVTSVQGGAVPSTLATATWVATSQATGVTLTLSSATTNWPVLLVATPGANLTGPGS